MDREIYVIEMRSLRRCLEHLRTLDLAGMEALAIKHGTASEVHLVTAVRAALLTIPRC